MCTVVVLLLVHLVLITLVIVCLRGVPEGSLREVGGHVQCNLGSKRGMSGSAYFSIPTWAANAHHILFVLRTVVLGRVDASGSRKGGN